ncbi:MAG: 16S rRNA (guanine(966)-N(2))-methyltransferase RsmD [Clostridia bacterium]|nr:16S rRNA (guanine(966)-N(2))-methyltransferase RsmD [Clostridia bacterium]
MRIIGGTHKGRVLKTFKGTEIRPTSDRARQAFFNIFAEKIIGASFLDGFAGTGAMGIEAISRGAKRVVFTDLKRASVELINQNLNMIKESATVMVCDLLSYLKTTPERFDFIFLDPPYMTDLGQKALEIIDKRKL